jgi:hypothetical protein
LRILRRLVEGRYGAHAAVTAPPSAAWTFITFSEHSTAPLILTAYSANRDEGLRNTENSLTPDLGIGEQLLEFTCR